MDKSADELCRLIDMSFANTERSNASHYWSIIAEFILNNQSGNFQTNNITPGSKRTQRLFDSTAIQANHDLAAAIHATLTNPTTKWSKIRFKDEELNNDDEAVMWLEEANNAIHNTLNESNFDTQVSKNYQAYTSLGTMVLFHDEDKEESGQFDGFRFEALHLAELAFSENQYGRVDTVYRSFELTARQALEKFGNKVSDETKMMAKESPDNRVEFYHAMYPRDPKQVKLNEFGEGLPKNRPFASVYLERKNKNIVQEGGFYEFPCYVVRWSTMPGEVYGRGPGHIALPDVRTLNVTKEYGLDAGAKAIAPPMLTTQRNVIGPLDLRPNRLSIVRSPDEFVELRTQARFDVEQFKTEDLRTSIKEIFFLDKLMLPPRTETGEMTAFEIQQRLEQMQRVLGPTLSRLNSEFLTPLIVRCFKMLLRSGQLGQIPEVIQEKGLNVDITFVNQLARSQQIADVTNLQAWIQDIMVMAQVKPDVVDMINADEIAKHTGKVRGIPEVAITNDKEVDAVRQQRAQQMAQAQELEQGIGAADIASKMRKSGGQQ